MKLLTELDSLDNVKDGETRILPTKVSQLQNDSGYTTNTGTITGVSVNSTSVATSGVANITSIPASILTGAIPSNVTATTQSSGDNSTKIATTAFVTTAISALPGAITHLKDGSALGSVRSDRSQTEDSNYSIGQDSFTLGYLTKASGTSSFAIGTSTDASGDWAFASGHSSVASGNYSHAEGYETYAIGVASHAEGNNTYASSDYAHAEGQDSIAWGYASHAEGGSVASNNYAHSEYNGYASGQGAHAEGDSTIASGTASHAEGNGEHWNIRISGSNKTYTVSSTSRLKVGTYIKYDNTLAKITAINDNTIKTDTILSGITITDASATFSNGGIAEGDNAHSEGYNTAALGDNSHAGGNYTIAGYENQTVIGKYNDNKSTTLFEVGKGTAQVRSNAFEVHSDGRATVGAGPTNNMDVATKQYADSVGTTSLNIKNGSAIGSLRTSESIPESSSYTLGDYAFAEGYHTRAAGERSHVEGDQNYATGMGTHSEGGSNKAIGNYSHAEGRNNTANGENSHVEGNYTTTGEYGSNAHAEGYHSTASESAAHAEGYYTEATNSATHAEGYYTTASGSYSHAEGYYTKSTYNSSHAEGYHTTSNGYGSHAEGYYTVAKSGHAEGDCTLAWQDGCHAEGITDTATISGTITAIDQENLKVTVSGISFSNNILRQLYSTNNTSFYGDQYMTNASWQGSNVYVFTLSKWVSSLAVNGNFYIKFRTMSTDVGAHAEGAGTKASSRASHAEGIGTVASAYGQHAEGKWNVANSDYLHIAGNGTADNARSNAYTLDWDGNGVYAGKLTVGTGPSNNMDVATKKYVDDSITELPEPMIFKGSLGTGGTITSLPTASASNEGYTYKVITAGTYASQSAKVGDTFISDGSTWVLIPSGDEPSGTVTSIKIEATGPIAVNDSSAITTSGTRTISHANSGVTAGTYRSVTVNATGHVTAGTNPTTLSGYGITDAKIANGVITLGSNTITPLTSHQDISGKLDKSGGTMTGNLTMAGKDISLNTTGSSSDDSGDIAWFYGNGQEKARLWTSNEYSAESGLSYRLYKKDGTSLFSGTIPLRDTKNTAGSTDTSSKIYLIGATSQAANPQTYSDNEVYATSGVLTTKSVQVGGTAATMQYNSTDKCIEFVFA